MKTLIGIVTFGNVAFTRLTVNEIWRNTSPDLPDLFVIVGKPGDHATTHWLEEQWIPHLLHHVNKGFAASLNDIWDYAWNPSKLRLNRQLYDNVIICGNDVLPYPGAIDAMTECAATTDWEWICSSQCDVRTLCQLYPEARQYFTGENYLFEGTAETEGTKGRPWDLHAPAVAATAPGIEPNALKDVQNLCLFKRSVFEKLGYFDANFWPNGYFSDNDYARRAVNAEVRGCGLPHSQYFHFWSRTIHQGETRPNDHYFRNNEAFYRVKWAGDFGKEGHAIPFGGQPQPLDFNPDSRAAKVLLPGSLRIGDRSDESAIVEFWSKR